MSPRSRAIALLFIQCLPVSSIAGKYLYERATRPRVWTRAVQYDPELPMRGRYLALLPMVDVCDLTRNAQLGETQSFGIRSFRVRLVARDGKLFAENAKDQLPRSEYQSVSVGPQMACDRAQLWPAIDYFVPENGRSPFPLKPGQDLWVEVTVPPSGPPRAVQLALSDNGRWQPLKSD